MPAGVPRDVRWAPALRAPHAMDPVSRGGCGRQHIYEQRSRGRSVGGIIGVGTLCTKIQLGRLSFEYNFLKCILHVL